jgi:hypothetical protein
MKAFIVLALVACAAARSLDIDTLRQLTKESLLTKDSDLLLKDRLLTNTHRFSLPKKALLNDFDYTVPTTYDDVQTYSPYSWTQHRVTILSLEELVSTTLFREYMRIPIFRQFWEQYPTVFQKYVESPLFQQFWQVPEFQQYFRNPIFFYKYIYPQIQVIAQSQSTEGVYNYDYGYNYNTVGDYTKDYTRRPFVGRDVHVGDYLNRILNRGVESRRTFYPYSKYETPSVYGQQYNTEFNHKFLLEKIYKTLFINKPTVGEVTQVRTDVKVAPAHKEIVVEPITGETKVVVEKPKILNVVVDEKIIPQTQTTEDFEGKWTVKEQLLKKLLVNKYISLELYQVLKTLPLEHVKEIVRRIAPSVFSDIDSSVFENVDDVAYPYHRVNDVDDVIYRQKINRIIDQLYNKELVGDRYTPVVRDLLKTFGHENTLYRDVPTTRFDDIIRRV